jgi:hypothetical protein
MQTVSHEDVGFACGVEALSGGGTRIVLRTVQDVDERFPLGVHRRKSGVQSRLSAGSAAPRLCHMLPQLFYFRKLSEDAKGEDLRHAAAHPRSARAVSNHTNGAGKRTS